MIAGRIAFVPATLALLPEYASRADPIAELRSACESAVRWLVADETEEVAALGEPLSAADVARGLKTSAAERIASALLDGSESACRLRHARRYADVSDASQLLVVANGSARRSTSAPGYLDESALVFDAQIERALVDGDPGALGALDSEHGAALMASGIEVLTEVGRAVNGNVVSRSLYRDDPFGVRYWVVTWTIE